MKKALFAALFLAVVFSIPTARVVAVTYDLSADWSDVQNPMGVWSLKKSPSALFTINQQWEPGSSQRGWADQPFPQTQHVPVWMKISDQDFPQTQGCKAQVGDIMLHGAESGRTGTNQTSVVFTSPSAGLFTVTGAIWEGRTAYRQMTWQVLRNGVLLSTGTMVSNGSYKQTNPFNLAMGTGGASILEQNLNVGDKIELAFISQSVGDFWGVNLGIAGSVPEPSSLFALLAGVGGLGGLMLRRRK